MYRFLSVKSWVFVIWLMLIGVALNVRPLMPVDETRYAAVAWEMWLRGDFLVPHLNGQLYSHKPPLLFWLIHLTWLVFGVNDGSLRLISPLFGLGVVYLTASITRFAWPERKETETLVPFMLLGTFFWLFYSTLTMFDMLLAFFAALGILSILKLARRGQSLSGWLLLGVAIGGGLLSKGPVILLHVLPAALLAPWWHPGPEVGSYWRRWYAGVFSSVLLGATIALCWAIPAGIAGGEAYRQAIFFGQTQGRLVSSFAHDLPWWWYLQFLPTLTLPWLLMTPVWSGLNAMKRLDTGLRFCLAWGLPVFLAFSLISGKRAHYLLPLMPLVNMVLARALTSLDPLACDWQRAKRGFLALVAAIGLMMAVAPAVNAVLLHNDDLARLSPFWGVFLLFAVAHLWRMAAQNAQESVFSVSLASVIALLVMSSAFFSVRVESYDMREIGTKIAEVFAQGRDVAFLADSYHGEFQFGGRLTHPVRAVSSIAKLELWAAEHAGAYVVIRYKHAGDLPDSFPYFHQRYRSAHLALLPVASLLSSPELKKILLD